MSVDNDYFLHFLDRELLETQGLYDKNLEQSIIRDVRFVLFSCIGNLIISASFLFESKYAIALFKEFQPLFQDGRFTIAITYESIRKMIEVKQRQYKGQYLLFPNYFNDLCYALEESGVVFTPKTIDTTLDIAEGMIVSLHTENNMVEKSHAPFISDVIEDRGDLAITHHLFEGVYTKRGVSLHDQDIINSLITEMYIKSYMSFFDANIPCGLSCGIYRFDYLSKDSLTSNISFWIHLYKRIGLYRFVCQCTVYTICDISGSAAQYTFLKAVDEWIHSQAFSSPLSSNFYKYINTLPSFPSVESLETTLYYNRIELISEILTLYHNSDSNRKIIRKEDNKMAAKKNRVFVVHGKNEKIKRAMFDFLRSLGLSPLEWESAVRLTDSTTPSTLEVVNTGIKNADRTVVLFTGDESVILREELRESGKSYTREYQPRPNVIFEAGMAMAFSPSTTIIVRIGSLREISDLKGINYVTLNNDAKSRSSFVTRLKTAGLDVDDSGQDWLDAGDFS